jgi:hypothetical protein
MKGKTRLAIGLLAAGLALGPGAVAAAQKPGGKEGDGKEAAPAQKGLSPAQEAALKQVKALLAEHKAAGAHVEVITDKATNATFSKATFVVVRFRQWPTAVRPPEKLKSQNVFAVTGPQSAEQLASTADLEKFFRAKTGPIKGPGQAKTILMAWLRLSQELVQDGFYTFEPPSDIKVNASAAGLAVSGEVQVKPERGNKGSLQAVLVFETSTATLSKVTETNKVVRGVRPRCQATRLLDPDPVIRAICEDDLLVMGLAAREYLQEQRAQASPELRRALDRIWQRILDEGR